MAGTVKAKYTLLLFALALFYAGYLYFTNKRIKTRPIGPGPGN